MKKIIFTLLFVVSFVVSANAEVFTKEVTKKWDAVAIDPDTDWFSSNIRPSRNSQRLNPRLNGRKGISSPVDNPVKHLFQFSCPTPTVINAQIKYNSIVKVHNFNRGIAIGANDGNQFSITLHKGMSYNIQHKTGSQSCALIITESFNVDL